MILWYTLCFVLLVHAQTCENYGVLNGTSCACPPGFGGSTCSQLGCGGTIFQGSQRHLTSSSTGSFANLTASTCQCESGWIGTGCNVCQTANACQAGFAAVNQVTIDSSSFNGTQGNETLVCNTQAQVYASSQMSCQVNVCSFFFIFLSVLTRLQQNPTLQSLYPLASTLNIIRTLQPGFTPIPNTTSFGAAGSVFAQLFYDGVEQFYCEADSCTQQLGTNSSANWQCSNLHCLCRPNTAFCGGVPSTNLTGTIDILVGSLEIDCGAVDNSTNTATCNFKQTVLDNVFGSSGLTLNGCSFGECVQQGVIDIGSGSTSNSTQSGSSTVTSLGGGVIAGLAVVGVLIVLCLFFLFLGLMSQRAARRKGFEDDEKSKVTVEWSQLSYVIPGIGKKNAFLRAFRKVRPDPTAINDDKVILDNVNGKVRPGQMMAILGPSGKLNRLHD
jgi:ABC-type multidrug transport system fused ATPase/permease subunit